MKVVGNSKKNCKPPKIFNKNITHNLSEFTTFIIHPLIFTTSNKRIFIFGIIELSAFKATSVEE